MMRRALISAVSLVVTLSAAPLAGAAHAETYYDPRYETPAREQAEAGYARQAAHRRWLWHRKRRAEARTAAGYARQEQHRDYLEERYGEPPR